MLSSSFGSVHYPRPKVGIFGVGFLIVWGLFVVELLLHWFYELNSLGTRQVTELGGDGTAPQGISLRGGGWRGSSSEQLDQLCHSVFACYPQKRPQQGMFPPSVSPLRGTQAGFPRGEAREVINCLAKHPFYSSEKENLQMSLFKSGISKCKLQREPVGPTECSVLAFSWGL